MNTGTKIRTLLAVVTSLNAALMAVDVTEFNNPTVDLIYRVLSIVLNFIVVASVTYYNNDYTEEATVATGEMRLKKAYYSGKEFSEALGEVEDVDFEETDEVAGDE